jgi:hypothetical protein
MRSAAARQVLVTARTLSPLERLQRENWALRDRIEELEGILGMGTEAPVALPARVNGKHWSRPTCWRLLGLLIARGWITKESAIIALCNDPGDPPDAKVLDVYISKLRSFLRPHSITITTHWGRGWSLSPEMKERAKELVRRINEGEHHEQQDGS